VGEIAKKNIRRLNGSVWVKLSAHVK